MDQQHICHCLRKIARERDAVAFKALYHHYFPRLLQFALLIVQTKEPAEEIINDVFLKIWNRKKQAESIEKPDVYFYVAVKNKSLDYLKSKAHQTTTLNSLSNFFLKTTVNPETIMVSKELLKKINDAIDDLPPKCKIIFKLIKEDGLKYKEVAAILDLSIKTIENQMGIATKKLSKTLLKTPEKIPKRGNK